MDKDNDPFEKKDEKDKDIIDLTDEARLPEDDIIDLSDVVDPSAPESSTDLLDLTEPITGDEPGDEPGDEEILDLIDAVDPSGDQEEILDLTEPVPQDAPDEDGVLDLLDAVEPDGDQDEIIDLTEAIPLEASDQDDLLDFIDIAEPAGEDEEILDLSDLADDSLEDAIAFSETVKDLEPEPEDHILDLTDEATDEGDGAPEKTSSITVPGPSYDQEILDLIDDIQSTLDETDGTAEEPEIDEQNTVDESLLADETDDTSIDPVVLVGKGETVGEDESVESEADLVDNLGIDLTSELNRDILSDGEEGESISEKDIPSEAADNTLGIRVEAIVERVLQEKLETILGRRIEDAVQKEFEKLRKDILDA